VFHYAILDPHANHFSNAVPDLPQVNICAVMRPFVAAQFFAQRFVAVSNNISFEASSLKAEI
jgi:hypothetical protein